MDLPVLESLRVASPCTASWDEMRGSETVRFCAQCGKNVYFLSGMTREAAEAAIREQEGALCARLYRQRDGTLLTADCPVGKSRLRRALLLQVGLVAGVFLAIPGDRAEPRPCRRPAGGSGRSGTTSRSEARRLSSVSWKRS